MGSLPYNENGTFNSNASLFDSEQPELNTIEAEVDSSTMEDYGLDKIFQPIKNDVKRELQLIDPYIRRFYEAIAPACPEKAYFVQEAKQFQNIYDDQAFDVIKYRDKITCNVGKMQRSPFILMYPTVHLMFDREGMPAYCTPSHIIDSVLKQDKLKFIKIDISIIKRDLMSFLLIFRLCGNNVQNKNELQAFIDIAEIKLLDLDIYWNNHLKMTVELNRQINIELNNSESMSKDIAELHSMYANIKQRLERVKLGYQNLLITWSLGDKLLMNLGMKFEGLDENQNSDYSGSDSESDMSNSDSESALSNLDSGSAISNSDSESVISNSDSERRSEFCNDDDQLETENLFNTDIIVDEDVVEQEETILETSHNSNARFRRMKWITGIFYMIVIILLSVDWLEPQCSEVCDPQNNKYKWSFELGLVYLNGPPPT
ncbi:uncharacterized protein LOC111026919 [Myzus persicae]|uniref:uncharacterized protein LOC111026919 n=1 Tax=Myzus persicae TaxID=13164 RepID=UPI000B932F1E|nr:uncharacterized protein LOC111026919 [Myzus persicae]